MRQRTVFRLCPAHQHLGAEGRHRLAEIVCEGGPAYGRPCHPAGLCEIQPGSDLFVPTATDAVAREWVENWTINERRNAESGHP